MGHLCPGLHATANFTMFRGKIGVATIFRALRFFVTSLLFSIAREGFRLQLILLIVFLNTSSLRRKADVKLIALVSL